MSKHPVDILLDREKCMCLLCFGWMWNAFNCFHCVCVGWRHRLAMWCYFCHCWGVQADWPHTAFLRGLHSGIQISWYQVSTVPVNLQGHLFIYVYLCFFMLFVIFLPHNLSAADHFTVVLPQGGAHSGTVVCTRWCQQRNAPDDHWDSKWEQSFPLWCYTTYLQRYYSAHHYHD